MHRIAAVLVAAATCWLAAGVARAEEAPSHILLDRSPHLVRGLEVSSGNRTGLEKDIRVGGPWRIVHTINGVRTWETANPIRPRTLFFHRAPKGMKMQRVGPKKGRKTLSYGEPFTAATKDDSWNFSTRSVQIRRPAEDGPPAAGEYILRYSRAIDREAALNQDLADEQDDGAFVFRSVQIDDTSRHGLYLPAPSKISFGLTVPAKAKLVFDARIIPPEVRDPAGGSDGARLLVRIGDESTTSIVDTKLNTTERRIEADLSPWAGKQIELHFETDPAGESAFDYVFLAAPTVYTPQAEPPRIVMVFIDTLRPDHMSLYGYERPTSPKLDAWAEEAAVFTEARSVAPWTLPSARTMLTGTHPERWDKAGRIQNLLATEGWATGFIAGNVYLSSNFEMAEGWDTHRCINWPQASVQIDRSLAFLDANADRPAFVLLHLMDMHLPYTEPITYRYKFASETPKQIGKDYFLRGAVTRNAKSEEVRQYVRDRYDNNMRYIDDQLERFLDTLRPSDTVVILSDHGEEFWEHGGFEHGHTLYDELLRVPMIAKGPGIKPGRFDEPVSLLDVAPTIASAARISTAGMSMIGTDLATVADRSRAKMVSQRPQAFGRPLYGLRQWGSLSQGHKYISHDGQEKLFDLKEDPTEQDNQASETDLAPWRDALSEALERPVMNAWRLVPNRSKTGKSIRVTLDLPTGHRGAWGGDDPTNSGKVRVEEEISKVILRWPKQRGRVEAFVLPSDPQPDQVDLKFRIGDQTAEVSVPLLEIPASPAGKATTLHKQRLSGRTVTLGTAWVPVPSDVDSAIDGFDAEVAGDLESLGYMGD